MSTFKTHPFLYKQKLKVLIYFQVAFVDFQKLDFLLLCYQVDWQLYCILLINSVIFQPLCLKTSPVRGKLFGISKKKGFDKRGERFVSSHFKMHNRYGRHLKRY